MILALLAFAFAGVQSSGLTAQVAPGVSYVTHNLHAAAPWGGAWGGAWAGPWANHWGTHGAGWYGPAAVDVSAPWAWSAGHGNWAGQGAWTGYGHGYPGVSLSQGPAYAGAYGHGVYVAKTRGAVHTAPLAGHLKSATALNVAPAPGTH